MRINEIFYSIQGEGFHSGTPAIFIRFSGCNIHCPFCDTSHFEYKDITQEEIIKEVIKYPASLVVLTGGEPSLQVNRPFVQLLKDAGKYVAIETNGTRELPENIDWVTVSPKEQFVGQHAHTIIKNANELKVIYNGIDMPKTFGITADYNYLQPCDTGDKNKNEQIIRQLIDYIKIDTKWKISLQTQKILSVR